MSAFGLARAALLALLALILCWQLWLSPPLQMPRALALALHVAPLLPALWLLLRRRAGAEFWAAVAALPLFCHGISEAWSNPAARTLALLEVALCVLIVWGASWDGMRARFARRRGV